LRASHVNERSLYIGWSRLPSSLPGNDPRPRDSKLPFASVLSSFLRSSSLFFSPFSISSGDAFAKQPRLRNYGLSLSPSCIWSSLCTLHSETKFCNWFRPHLTLQVVEPNAQTVCHGGEPCVVQWLDDGVKPLLADMGPCYVALFSGNQARL
jgi:hypothetical protein